MKAAIEQHAQAELTLIQTMLNVIDNSGAAVAECIQVLKMKRHAKIGTYNIHRYVKHTILIIGR